MVFKPLHFGNAWHGVCKGIDYEIKHLRKYAIPEYIITRDLWIQQVRLTRLVDIDSHVVNGWRVNDGNVTWKRSA